MTVNTTETGPFNYSGNGITTSFPFTGKIQNENQVGATLLDANGVLSVLVLNTDFTVQNITEAAADIVLTTAPATGETLSLFYDIDTTQLTDYIEGGKFPASSHEDALDKLTLLLKQLQSENTANISMPPTFTGDAPDFPLPVSNNVIGWNAAATDLVNIAPEDIATIEFGANNFVVDTFVDGVDYTSGTSTTVTLSGNPGSENNTQITFDGLMQHKDTYSISGTVVTFDAPIPNGVASIECMRAAVLGIGVPSDGTVGTSALVDGAVTTAKLAPDAGFTSAGTTAERSFAARGADIINVKDFGAVGDGVADDRDAFQAAIDAARDNFSSVYVPAGTYKIDTNSGTISIWEGVSIRGVGSRQVRRYSVSTQPASIIHVVGTANSCFTYYRGVHVTGLFIDYPDQDEDPVTPTVYPALFTSDAAQNYGSKSTFTELTIIRCYEGWKAGGGTTWTEVNGCFYRFFITIQQSAALCHIQNCTCSALWLPGDFTNTLAYQQDNLVFVAASGGSDGMLIDGCTVFVAKVGLSLLGGDELNFFRITDCLLDGVMDPLVNDGTVSVKNAQFDGCLFRTFNTYGSTFRATSMVFNGTNDVAVTYQNVSFNGCVFRVNQSGFIKFESGVDTARFSGCSFLDWNKQNLSTNESSSAIFIDDTNCSLSIDGCTFDCELAYDAAAQTRVVTASDAKRISITSCDLNKISRILTVTASTVVPRASIIGNTGDSVDTDIAYGAGASITNLVNANNNIV